MWSWGLQLASLAWHKTARKWHSLTGCLNVKITYQIQINISLYQIQNVKMMSCGRLPEVYMPGKCIICCRISCKTITCLFHMHLQMLSPFRWHITAVLKGTWHGRKRGKTFTLSNWFCIGCSAHQQPPGNTCEQSRLQWTHQDPEILHPPSGHAALLRQTLCCKVRSYQVQPPLFTPQAHRGNTAASTSYERRDICSLAIFHLTKWWWKLEP